MYNDVCSPINIQVREGYKYFIIVTDDFSRYDNPYLMHRKFEFSKMFKEFKGEAERQLGKTLKPLRLDHSNKYPSTKFKDFLKDCRIVSQFITSYTHQQNGVAKKRNRTLLDVVHFMISYLLVPTSF